MTFFLITKCRKIYRKKNYCKMQSQHYILRTQWKETFSCSNKLPLWSKFYACHLINQDERENKRKFMNGEWASEWWWIVNDSLEINFLFVICVREINMKNKGIFKLNVKFHKMQQHGTKKSFFLRICIHIPEFSPFLKIFFLLTLAVASSSFARKAFF